MFLARWDRHLVGKKWKVLISNLIFFASEQERRKGIIRTVSKCLWFKQLLHAT